MPFSQPFFRFSRMGLIERRRRVKLKPHLDEAEKGERSALQYSVKAERERGQSSKVQFNVYLERKRGSAPATERERVSARERGPDSTQRPLGRSTIV